MKKIVFLLGIGVLLVACGNGGADLDQTDPKSVVEQIFNAAESGDLSTLNGLCDPNAENDGDTKRVCDVSNSPKEEQDEFISYFKTGKINGEVTLEGDKAMVPIKFGPDGDRDETMELVKRNENWYLYSF